MTGILEKLSYENFMKVIWFVRRYGFMYTLKKIKEKLKPRLGNLNSGQLSDFGQYPGEHYKDVLLDLYKTASCKSAAYVELEESDFQRKPDDIKYIAFYLPQFHPIKENNEWWGRGFTEWTNVSKAVPQFKGHYQPHLPGELGFYDLRIVDVMRRQAELAKSYGIYGFCFHHYWFGGKRLLEQPVNQFLDNTDIDIPFCLCWANENWTRRWDGMESEILMAQQHSPEDDIAFIEDLVPSFKDSRYIRISGKPVLIVYRPKLLPNPKETAERWRDYCRKNGIGEIFLIGSMGFGYSDPVEIGFDASVEFPPHTIFSLCPDITKHINVLNPEFKGQILNYRSLIKDKKYLDPAPFKLFKTVSPGWDNTARKPDAGVIFHGSTPELYKEWLTDVSTYTNKVHNKDEQIVFINAWNEWAEGTHLEPDRKYGYAHLQATREALLENRSNRRLNKNIIVAGHDAEFNGAQVLLLYIIKTLTTKFKYRVHLLLGKGGELEKEYRKYATVYNINSDYKEPKKLDKLISILYKQGIDVAITNTVVCGEIVKALSKSNIKTVSLIHELTETIRSQGFEDSARKIAKHADKVVFPSDFVRQGFLQVVDLDEHKAVIKPQGKFFNNNYKRSRNQARIELRKFLGIEQDKQVVVGIGYAYRRKGIDLFLETAKKVNDRGNNVYFVWVGARDEDFIQQSIRKMKINLQKSHVLFIDPQQDLSFFYAGADIFLMTSREDPFPSVVIEAMEVGLPVIGFADAGGFTDIVTEETGILVPYCDTDVMASNVELLLKDSSLREILGSKASKLIEEQFSFKDYIYFLLELLGHDYKKVSVVVPNYNYERYIEERLQSIFDQTYPVYDLVILDDCSTDNSVEKIKQFLAQTSLGDEAIFLRNKVNSGSVFKQWKKGIAEAKGDYVWIAEADDLCKSDFLEKVVSGMSENVVLGYAQSKQIDSTGKTISPNYLDYTNDIDSDKWKQNYINSGVKEITCALAVKNTIPNISAVVFKKPEDLSIFDETEKYKIAGDWLFYIKILAKGSISFIAESLNYHRRHVNSVTVTENNDLHFQEIVSMQNYVSQTFEVPNEVWDKALQYREKVKRFLQVRSIG